MWEVLKILGTSLLSFGVAGLCAITTVGYANDAVKALDKKN